MTSTRRPASGSSVIRLPRRRSRGQSREWVQHAPRLLRSAFPPPSAQCGRVGLPTFRAGDGCARLRLSRARRQRQKSHPTRLPRSVSSKAGRQWMPMGTWQPPPSAASAARSAVTAKRVSAWSRNATASMVAASSLRVSMPSAPWPAAGQKSLGPAARGPNRSCPADRVRQQPAESRPPGPRPACAAACLRCRETRPPRCRAGAPSTARGGAGCWCPRARRAAARQDWRGSSNTNTSRGSTRRALPPARTAPALQWADL